MFHLQTGSRIGLAYGEMRPRHMVEAMRMLQDFGIEMRDFKKSAGRVEAPTWMRITEARNRYRNRPHTHPDPATRGCRPLRFITEPPFFGSGPRSVRRLNLTGSVSNL